MNVYRGFRATQRITGLCFSKGRFLVPSIIVSTRGFKLNPYGWKDDPKATEKQKELYVINQLRLLPFFSPTILYL